MGRAQPIAHPRCCNTSSTQNSLWIGPESVDLPTALTASWAGLCLSLLLSPGMGPRDRSPSLGMGRAPRATLSLCHPPGAGATLSHPVLRPPPACATHPGTLCPCATQPILRSLCHPPWAVAASFCCSGLPKKSTSGCGKQKKQEWSWLWSRDKSRAGWTLGRAQPPPGSSQQSRSQMQIVQEGPGNANGFKSGGERKYKAQVGFYSQERAGS